MGMLGFDSREVCVVLFGELDIVEGCCEDVILVLTVFFKLDRVWTTKQFTSEHEQTVSCSEKKYADDRI